MERIMSDSYRRQLLWDRKMAVMDYKCQMSAAEKRGISIGEAKGISIGEARGEARGRKDGMYETLAGLVKDHIISEAEAARRADVSVPEFRKIAALFLA